MTSPQDLWLSCFARRRNPRERLICFPHAGGSASFFRDWGERLPTTEVYAVRYPGRGERIEEAAPTNLRELGRDIANAVQVLADRPLALFGHSMGAAVALETARALEARGVRPVHLLASGSRNAPCPAPAAGSRPEEDDTAAVMRELVELGGTDPELAADPFFQELVLPYIRSDGEMFHAYDFQPVPRLLCPITTIVGDSDPDADLRPWKELTESEFREHSVPGDHFYLRAQPPLALILEAVRG